MSKLKKNYSHIVVKKWLGILETSVVVVVWCDVILLVSSHFALMGRQLVKGEDSWYLFLKAEKKVW